MLDSEMIEDTAKIVNEAIKDRLQGNRVINNRAGGNAPLIAEKIAERLHMCGVKSTLDSCKAHVLFGAIRI